METDNKTKATETKQKPTSTIKKTVETDEQADKGFDIEAYETYTRLSFEKKLRRKETLKKEEQEALEKAKKPALANKGKKALVTDTYRVQMRTVRLMEGVPTPPSIVRLFSKKAQEKLFE